MSLFGTRFDTCYCSRTPSETILVQLMRRSISHSTLNTKTSDRVANLTTSGDIFAENPSDLLQTINLLLYDYLSVHVELRSPVTQITQFQNNKSKKFLFNSKYY